VYLDRGGGRFSFPVPGLSLPHAAAQFESRGTLDSEPLGATAPLNGHINRLKAIKRQTYGRAGFELLKARVDLCTESAEEPLKMRFCSEASFTIGPVNQERCHGNVKQLSLMLNYIDRSTDLIDR
jgi:hypothetical protein